MNNKNQTHSILNKRISTSVGILVIILVAVITGGILTWQYLETQKEEIKPIEIKTSEKTMTNDEVEKYLYKDVILHGVKMPPEAEYHAISLEEAILSVAQHLENKRVEDIKVYHVLWSVAPVGQFHIAGECNFSRGDKNYSKFLASIRDGSEEEVGEPKFLFKGLNIWYSDPESQIIYKPNPELPRCEQPDDEFLGNYEAMAEFYNVSSVFKVVEIQDEIADWKIYDNSEASFTFKYPNNWEVKQDYLYKTAAGIEAKNRTVTLRPIGDERSEIINVNVPQIATGYDPSICEFKELCGGNYIATCIKEPEILEVYHLIINSFQCIKDETADWNTYRNEEYGFEMKYPEDLFPEQVLQPKIKLIQCDYANFVNNCPTEMTTINGMPFCLQETDGAAAGTTYTTYNYTTVRDMECFVVFFTVPYPNCSNYLPIESQEIQEAYDKCRLDNEVIKPEIINQMLSTFRFLE